jgi:hypothetical protein
VGALGELYKLLRREMERRQAGPALTLMDDALTVLAGVQDPEVYERRCQDVASMWVTCTSPNRWHGEWLCDRRTYCHSRHLSL